MEFREVNIYVNVRPTYTFRFSSIKRSSKDYLFGIISLNMLQINGAGETTPS